MLRLILVITLGCVLDRDDRNPGSPLRYWLTVAAMLLVSI
jgi:hypothetical protein